MSAPAWRSRFSAEEITEAEGFVYRITHLPTGRMYIGRKYTKTTVKRCTRPARIDAYWGSSRPLNALIKSEGYQAFEREIISLHATRAETDYAEVEAMFANDVLRTRLPDGSPAYFNLAIPGRWFRAPKTLN